MRGTINVEVPQGCQNCDFFQLISRNKLLINYGYCNTEETDGACHCMLIKNGKRLKPLDNGEILIETPIPTSEVVYDEDIDELVEVKSVHYETTTYKGRPEWCPIKVEGWQ